MMRKVIKEEFYIVVDVESAGPNSGDYALNSIGACTLYEPRETFYIELIPDSDNYTEEAFSISNFSIEYLKENGIAPKEAMQKFNDWVKLISPPGVTPVFTAFNAAYDWMFINEYFHRYLKTNPFGYKALDIKAFYMGKNNLTWSDTSFKQVSEQYLNSKKIDHHALQDAIDTAIIFQGLLKSN
jgi:DNA polymerase III epsilon subunit-like protein